MAKHIFNFNIPSNSFRSPFWFKLIRSAFIVLPMASSSLELTKDVLGRLGLASGTMDEKERKIELHLACEVSKATLLSGAEALVREAAGRPIVTIKSCDGTPITTTHRSLYVQPSGKRVRMSGRQCH